MPEKRKGVPRTPFDEPRRLRRRTPEALEHDLTTVGYEYLQTRGISDEVIDASGVRWVRMGKADGTDTAADYGFPQRSLGLFFPTRPLLARDDLRRGILRRFDNGAGSRKFVNQKGAAQHLFTPPGFEAGLQVGRDYLNTPDAQDETNEHGYIVAEGVTRVLALASIRLPSLGMNGSFGWRGKNRSEGGTTPLPDWEAVAVKGQPLVIGLDGDLATNPDVHDAGARLSRWLMGKGARSVSFILLPPHFGLDDWIAEQRAAGLEDDAIRWKLSALRRDLPERPIHRPAIVTARDDDESPNTEVSDWIAFGAWWNQRHGRGRWVYSPAPDALGWWAYVGNVWRPLLASDPRLLDLLAINRYRYASELAAEGKHGFAQQLAEGSLFNSMVKQGTHSDLLVGLRHACRGTIPTPERHHVGTPSGIVDLRDGSFRSHSPEFGIRALTTGEFSADVDAHKWALGVRFSKVFTEENLRAYIRLTALALTGLAQSYRAIVMVTGDSGSGKGDASNVVVWALGDRAMGVGSEWLAQKQRSEIDAVAASILERQPAVLKVDEISGDTQIGISRLLSLTGNTAWSYRRPHGLLLTGWPGFQLWTTAVSVPEIQRRSGIDRRLAVLQTKGTLDDADIDEEGGHAPELLNAVVSLACLQSAEVYRRPYHAPEGSRQAKQEALDEMDQVAVWLEAQDDLDGLPVADARARAVKALGLSFDALSANSLGSRVRQSVKWKPGRTHGGVRIVKRR